MPLCSDCRADGETVTVGPEPPAWLKWFRAHWPSRDDPEPEPERCSRCDLCGEPPEQNAENVQIFDGHTVRKGPESFGEDR